MAQALKYGFKPQREGVLPGLRREAAVQRAGTRLHPLSLRDAETGFGKEPPRREERHHRGPEKPRWVALSRMKKRILIAEDMQATRDVVRFLLTNRGFEVIEASNGNDALEK